MQEQADAKSGTFSVPTRRSKEISLAEAGRIIASKTSLSLAGSQLVNAPMALLREAIRAGARELTVIPAIDASYSIDLMIATGIIKTLIVSYVGFETLGLAPAFRAAAENKTIELIEADEPFIVHGTRAAAAGLPFIPLANVYEATDLPNYNKMLKQVVDPYSGEMVTTIPALKSEICILHAQEVDPYGNAQIWSGNQQELDKAKAADTVIISAERIVSVDKSRVDPRKVTIPGHLVDAVVHAPFGAHPTMSPGFYVDDELHLRDYVTAARKGLLSDYLDRYVRRPSSNTTYLEAVGIERLTSLMREL